MTNTQRKVLSFIESNKSVDEIKKELNISNKRLVSILQSLKNNGYNYLNKNFVLNGQIDLKSKKSNIDRDKLIRINEYPSEIEFLLISDTHIGSKRDRLDLLNKTYDYAIKNNINTIFHLGDIIDGRISNDISRNKSIDNQLQYFIKNYPYAENVITYLIRGNHDFYGGIDLKSFIEANRLDLIPFSLQYQRISIANDVLGFLHDKTYLQTYYYQDKIRVFGHSHKYSASFDGNNLDITLPSISNIAISNILETGIVRMHLRTNNEGISTVFLTHNIFTPEIVTCGEQRYTLKKEKD